jgi:uncharacterized protein DUF4326
MTEEAPHRIQCRRVKGWRMPPNTVYVGRPTKWGNPFKPGEFYRDAIGREHEVRDLDHAIILHRACAFAMVTLIQDALRGKNLACWCPLDKSCHADVLLEIANR